MIMAKRRVVLSVCADSKTIKNAPVGYLTGILYLAPAWESGVNLCPMAQAARCDSSCLYKAGRGQMPSVIKARMAKTRRFLFQREAFMADVVYSIRRLVKSASRLAMTPLVRLNGTSDIRWEQIPVAVDGCVYASIFEVFPYVQFYDYTKISNRRVAHLRNYDLTFSYSGTSAFWPHVRKAVDRRMRIAVVFGREEDIPKRFMGMKVIRGDDSDVRHEEPQGVVVALIAKGPARHIDTGFVQHRRAA